MRSQLARLSHSDVSSENGVSHLSSSAKKQQTFPVVIGETGTTFNFKKGGLGGLLMGRDENERGGEGGYKAQGRALDASLNACDGENVLGHFIWCYYPDNTTAGKDDWVKCVSSFDESSVTIDENDLAEPRRSFAFLEIGLRRAA